MRTLSTAALLCSLVVAAAAIAADEPTNAPTTAPAVEPAGKDTPAAEGVDKKLTTERKGGRKRLTLPWSRLTDLSDEQRSQIVEIHAETVEKINALKQEEKERCMALLTEEQKVALEEAESKAAAERKARAAEAKKAG